jgi:outer membrane lipoprotein LolB
MSKFSKNFVAAIFLLLFFSGCAITPKPTLHYLAWSSREKQLSSFDHWIARGKIAINFNRQSTVCNFIWQQNGDQYLLDFSGPLNFGKVRIMGNKNQVTLWQDATHSFTEKSPEQLVARKLGWQLPISQLKYWVRGIPASSPIEKIILTPTFHLEYLAQNGWKINYLTFSAWNNIDLPEKISLSGFDFVIKIAISEWSVTLVPGSGC